MINEYDIDYIDVFGGTKMIYWAAPEDKVWSCQYIYIYFFFFFFFFF